MKASIQFLWTGKGFNSKEIETYGHGFIIASHVSEQLQYILYASHRHPWHTELIAYFLRHHKSYTILGGGGIVRHKGTITMYPITSSAGYIPMSVATAILPLLQSKMEKLGIQWTLWIESHEDQIKEVIKKLSKNWELHTENFRPCPVTSPGK